MKKKRNFINRKARLRACMRPCIKNKLSIDNLFTSNEAKIIYTLLNHEGEKRAEILGITREMYSSLKKSKKWHNNLAKLIHPDVSHYSLATEAISELNNIYEKMKKYGK